MANGFTAIWLRVRLRDAAQTDIFPELGDRADEYHREALSTLCRRAAGHGVGVYLYFNEPLCFPSDDPFLWLAHPEVRGASGSIWAWTNGTALTLYVLLTQTASRFLRTLPPTCFVTALS